jgi:hypothetical protein
MNDKLEQLYNLYIDKGILTDATPFEVFSQADANQIGSLYDLGKNKGLFQTTDVETFSTAWGTETVKKKEDTVSVLEDGSSGLQEPSVQVEQEQIDVDVTPGITALEETGVLPTQAPRDFTQPFLGPVGMDDPMSVEEQQELLKGYNSPSEVVKSEETLQEETQRLRREAAKLTGLNLANIRKEQGEEAAAAAIAERESLIERADKLQEGKDKKFEQEKEKRNLEYQTQKEKSERNRKIGYVLKNLDDAQAKVVFQNIASTRGEIADDELQQLVDVANKKTIEKYGQEEYDLVQKIGGNVTPEDLFYGGKINTSPSIVDELVVEGDETTTVSNLNNEFAGTSFAFSESIYGSDAVEVSVLDISGVPINSKIVRLDDGAKASQQLRDFMAKANLSKGNKEFLEGKINGKDISNLPMDQKRLANYKYMLENKDKFSAGKGAGFSMDANAIMRFVNENPDFFPPEELQSIKLQLDEALADQYKEDEQLEGSFFSSLGESFLKGATQTSKFTTNLGIDIGGALMPSMFMPSNSFSAINFDENGNRLSDSEVIDKVKKKGKREMIAAMDNAVESSFTGTTQAWMNSEERNDLAKALNFVFESLGVVASVGGGNPAPLIGRGGTKILGKELIKRIPKYLNPTLQSLAFFAYAANGIEDEMAGTEYDDLSEWKKKLISFPYGVMIGQLEKLGWEASTGAFGNKVFDKISKGIISKAMKSVPKNASPEVIKTAIENNTKAAIADGTIKIISGALSEGFVEGTQEFGDVGLKNVVNLMMDKDYFADAPDLSTQKGWLETIKQAKESGYYGLLAGASSAGGGGIIQGTKKRLQRDADIREYNEQKQAHTDELLREKLIFNINARQQSGEITSEQAEAAKEQVAEDAATYEQIPDEGLSNKNKIESFALITERNNLEKEIAGKNEELVTKQKDRIRDINAQLTIIGTQDATTEQESSDLDEDQQAGDVQEMEEGTPQPEPEQTTAEEVEVKEELKPTEEQRKKLEKKAIRELKRENRQTRRKGFKGDRVKGTRKKYEPTQEEIDARVDELFQEEQQEDQEVLDLEAAIEGEVKEGRALPSETTAVEEVTGSVPEDVAVEEEVATEEAPVDETVVEEEVTTEAAPLVNPKVVISGTGDGHSIQTTRNTEKADIKNSGRFDSRGKRGFDEDGFLIREREDGGTEVVYKITDNVNDRVGRPGSVEVTVILPKGSNIDKQVLKETFDKGIDELAGGGSLELHAINDRRKIEKLADDVVEALSTKATSDATQMITPVPTKTETKKETPTKKAPTKTKVDGVVMSDKKRSKKEQALVDRAKRAAKALTKIGKGGVTIEVHDDTDSFKKVTGQDGRGAYDKTSNTIHINLSKANNTTVAHEAFHAVLLQKVGNTAKVTKTMFDAVRKAGKGDTRVMEYTTTKVVDGKTETVTETATVEEYLEDFASNYEENVQDEEKLAELTGLLASSYVNLAPAPKSKVRQWVEKVMTPIAEKLGIKVDQFTKTDQGVVDLLNAISAKVTIGEEIQEGDVKVLEEIETKPETKKGKAKKINWTKSEGKRPKRKTTGTEMGKVVRSYEAGEITLEEYNKKADELMPTRMKEKFTEPATNPELGKLRGQKKAKINAPIKEGADVGLRLDIPLMEDTGVSAVTIHPGRGLTSSASSYRGAAVISNVEFKSNPKSSLGLASEATTKNPTIARMAGSFVNIGETIEEQNEAAKKLAQQAMNEGWTQVGVNPSKHSYFYDRSNGKPLKSADRVVQVGDLIYAENAKTTTIYDDRFIVKGKTDKKGGPLRFQKEGVELIAPNGKPSNLTEEQYKLVRTPAFKKFFGDWESDPKNASKIVDENGEPQVVYHGTFKEFEAFDKSKGGTNTVSVEAMPRNNWFWFSNNEDISSSYGSNILPVFLNVRNPQISEGAKLAAAYKDALRLKKDGIIAEEVDDSRRTSESLEVKGEEDVELISIDDKDFTGSLRSEIEGGESVAEMIALLEEYIEYSKGEVRQYREEYPQDVEYLETQMDQARRMINAFNKYGRDGVKVGEPIKGDVIAIEKSNQAKLADGSNKTFDPQDERIRFQKEGVEIVYHGSPNKIEGGKLKKGMSGAIFLTPSKKYAEGYLDGANQGEIIETTITEEKKSKLFDLRNQNHVERLKQGFLNNNEELEIEYDTKEGALRDYENAIRSMKEASEGREGLNDWASGSQFIEAMENAGFEGAVFAERPAGFLDEGTVVSYALFDKEFDVSQAQEETQDTQTEPFKGGKFVESPADGLMRRQVGGFEVTYVEQDRMADLMKEGLVTQPKDLSDFADNYVAITAPDDMLAGQISYKGKPIFDGGGGVFFTTKYGDVWASGNRQTAETLTKIINESVKRNNGKGYLVLAKGTDSKLVSSVSGVESSLAILDIMLEEGMVSPSDFRRAVSEAVRKNGGSISLRKSAKELKKDVTDYFNNPKTSTFDKRGNVVKDLIGNLAKSKSLKENKAEIIDLLGGDKSKGLGAGVTPKSQSLVDLVAKVAAEQVTKGLKVGDIYAVIEVDGEVEVKEDSHPSYPFHVVSKTKSKPILHLPQDRQAGKNILTSSSGKPYSVDVVSVKSGTFNDASTMTSDLSETAMREQKSLMQIGRYYNANNQGFFPSQVNSYQLKQDLEQIGFGLKRAVNGAYYATRNGRKVNPFPPEPSRYRFQRDDIGIVEEKSFTSKNTVADIIIAARREGFKDKAIRFYILNRRSDIKEENGKPLRAKTVDDMLRLPANILENVPDSFKEIEGGAAAGLRLYQKVEQLRDKLLAANARIKSPKLSDAGIKQKIKEKREELKKKKLSDEQLAKELDAFTKREYKNNKARKEMKTESEIMDEVIEFLEKQPEYIEAGDKGKKTPSLLQSKMQAELQATIAFRPSREVAQNLSKLKNRARAMEKAGRDLQEIKRQLRATLRKSLPKAEYSKPEVMTLLGEIAKVDEKNLQDVIGEIESFIVNKNVQILEAQIDKLLGTKVTKSEAGRRKGKFGYDEAARLEAINNNIVKNKEVDGKTVKYTAKEIMDKNERLRRELNEIMRQPELSSENINKLTDLQIAININSANLMKAQLGTKERISPNIIAPLVTAQESLQELIEEGRSKFKVELQEAHQKYQEQFTMLWEEITGEKIDMSDPDVRDKINARLKESSRISKAEKAKNRGKFRNVLTNMYDSIVRGFNKAEDLSGLMNKISIMPGELAGGRIQEMITDRVDESTRVYKGRMMIQEDVIENKMEEIFGGKRLMKIGSPEWRKRAVQLNDTKTNGITLETKDEVQTISQNQLAYLYNQYKDPANAGSFKAMFGENYEQEMSKLISKLDPQLKEWADWQVDEFFPSVYEYYNEAYKKIYRTDMPWNQFYAGRIYREGFEQEPLDMLANSSIFQTSVGAASTLERAVNNLPIQAMNINNALTSYIQDMEYFAAHAETVRDIDKMFTNKDVRKYLKNIYGEDINNLIDSMIKKVSAKGQQKFKMASFINKSMNAFIISKLAFNPVVFIKQLTSIPTYANDIGIANWIKYSKLGSTLSQRRSAIMEDYNEVIKNSVYLQDRAKGLNIRNAIAHYEDHSNSIIDKSFGAEAQRIAMMLTKSGDKAAIMLGGLPNYRYYKAQYKKQNPKATEQEVIDYAIRKFERDTKKTQQSSDIQDRDYYQTDDPLMRSFNMFMTTPKQYLRKEIDAFRNLGRKIRAMDSKAGKGTVGQNLRQLAMYHVMMPALFQWAALGFPVDMDDEDKADMAGAMLLGNLNALFIVGDLFTMTKDVILEKPWGGTPESLSIFQWASSVLRKWSKWQQKIDAKKPDPTKIDDARYDFYGTILEGVGIPARQGMRYYDNYTKLFTEKMDTPEKIRRILNYSDYTIEGNKKDKKKGSGMSSGVSSGMSSGVSSGMSSN